MRDVLGRAEELSEDLIAVRRKIHANPETGFELTETLKLVTEQLASMGITPERVGKAGLVLSLGKQGGKTFLLPPKTAVCMPAATIYIQLPC